MTNLQKASLAIIFYNPVTNYYDETFNIPYVDHMTICITVNIKQNK